MKEVKLSGSMREFFKVRVYSVNLIILVVIWTVSSFDWFLVNFELKYIKGNIFLNTVIASLSEIPAHILSGLMYYKFGARITFATLFAISLLGSILYIFVHT